MLNRTPETLRTQVEADRRRAGRRSAARGQAAQGAGWSGRAWQFFTHLSLSSLTRRIIFLNVAGLVVLVIGILYLSQFRAGLIDARIQSLMMQGEIIANAIAASGTVDPDGATIDPERLLELQLGESYDPSETGSPGLDFPINPVRVAPILQRLVSPTNTRARIYERDGTFILDSLALYDVLRFDLPPPEAAQPNYFERRLMALRRWLDARRPADLSRARASERQGLRGGRDRADRPEVQHGADQRARRGHRLGGGAGAALPRGARRADALDPGRRNRRHGHGRAARRSSACS